MLLLLAQFGASAHAITHLGDPPEGSATAGMCEWCAAYPDVMGSVPPSAAPAIIAPSSEAPAAAGKTFRDLPPPRLAYRSQAPPRLS